MTPAIFPTKKGHVELSSSTKRERHACGRQRRSAEKGKIGKIYTFLTCGQLNIMPKKIAVRIPHRERYLSKYTHHSKIVQNLHIFILWPFTYHSKNSTCLNLHTEKEQVKYHTWQSRSLPSCTHPCSLEAIVSQLLQKFVPDTHTAFIPVEISHLTVYSW